jgi:hypothetical protein
MPIPHRYSLRIMIQRMIDGRSSTLRIVACAGNRQFPDSHFSSKQALLSALRAVLPDFDDSALSFEVQEHAACSIVFSGEMELSYLQLSALGLG